MQLFANNADSSLNGAIAPDTLVLTLKTGEGTKFPSPSNGDYFLVTLYQKLGSGEINHEIVKCTSRAGDNLTIVRAQEGTTAKAFNNGDPVELRVTAGTLDNKVERGELDNKQPIDDDLTAIAALTGTSGLLKKTFTNTWSLDTAAYLTDAPSDGKIYGRKDSVWTEVVAGGSEDTTTSFTYTYTGVLGMAPVPLPGSGSLLASPTGNERAFNVLFIGAANSDLTGIEFTKLEFIGGNFSPFSMNSLTNLSLPVLKAVGGNFSPSSMGALTNLSVPALTTVGGNFSPATMASLTNLSLPALTTIGSSFITSMTTLTSLSLPALTTVGGNFNPYLMNSLTNLSLPVLKTVGGNFILSSMASLASLSLPALTTVVGSFNHSSMATLTSLSLPALKTVVGNFDINNMATLTSLSLPAIERIGASVTSGNAIQINSGTNALTTFTLPATLKQVGGTAGSVTIMSAALDQASVDSILIRLAALDGTGGTVEFSNRMVTITGTSAAPSSAGLAAKATLVARGCTVTHK